MELFPHDPTANLLPRDGAVHYFGAVLTATEADRYLAEFLREIPWRSDETVMFGKHIVTARKVAWFADGGRSYTYSGTTKAAAAWTPALAALKELAENRTGARFNACLLNRYHDGDEGMGWHSDNEKEIVYESAIASLSLGAEREFRLKHKETDERVAVSLTHGSLLVMRGATQRNWLHCIPKTKKVRSPRVNLTFRLMADG